MRVGRLHEYRLIEKSNRAVNDPLEGIRHAQTNKPASSGIPSRLLQPFGIQLQSVHVSGFDNTASVHFESPDYYIYCASSSFDATAMKHFGYDSCIRIEDTSAMFQMITEVLTLNYATLPYFDAQPITYGNKNLGESPGEESKLPNWALKDSTFSYQHETRARWAPVKRTGQNLEALPILAVPSIRNFISLYQPR
jgi:hypothetical protein